MALSRLSAFCTTISFCVLFALAFARTANAAHISWHADLTAATRESKQDSKPLLVKVSTTWCGYCVKMQRETFNDAAVVNKVEKCFVPVAIDGDENQALIKRLGINTFPTTLIVSPEMKVLKKIVGFRSPIELNGDMQSACQVALASSSAATKSSRGVRVSVFGKLCPVTLSMNEKAVDGDLRITTVYEGFRLAFKSEAHREEFTKHPKKYWPVVDGICVVSALDEDNVTLGKLSHAMNYQGRHWLFASESHREQFQADPASYVAKLRALAAAKRNRK